MLLSAAANAIQVREIDGFSVVLQGQAKHKPPTLPEIRTLALMPAGASPNPIVVAGDSAGFITLLTMNSQN
jgi:hypothetical protein